MHLPFLLLHTWHKPLLLSVIEYHSLTVSLYLFHRLCARFWVVGGYFLRAITTRSVTPVVFVEEAGLEEDSPHPPVQPTQRGREGRVAHQEEGEEPVAAASTQPHQCPVI